MKIRTQSRFKPLRDFLGNRLTQLAIGFIAATAIITYFSKAPQ